MTDFKKLLLGGVAAFSLMAVAGGAAAQSGPTNPPQDEEEATEIEEVIVTGSRIRRDAFNSASPVQVITAEEAALEGLTDMGELLQTSAAASGSTQINNQLTGYVATGGQGTNTLSLRGLGAQRTLTLLNGRRAGPAGTQGQVQAFDLNVIPLSMVERVEILSDGASSIYGSDAIAGVVNIITRRNLDGFDVGSNVNRSFDGGGDTQRHYLAWGNTVDRGSLMVGLDYYRQEPLTRGEREDTACAADYLFDPSDRTTRLDHLDLSGEYKCSNLFASALRVGGMDLIYNQPGVTYPTAQEGNNSFVNGMSRQNRPGFPGTYPYGLFDSPLYDRTTMLSPTTRYTATVMGHYELSPEAEFYGEFLINRRESEQFGVRQFFPSIAANNPGNTRPDTGLSFGTSSLPIIGVPTDQAQQVDYIRGVAGIRGEFASTGFLSGWDWDIYAQFSRSEATYDRDFIYNDRVRATTGALGCNQAAITISGGQCSDLTAGFVPWTSQRVLEGGFNAEELAFLFGRERGVTIYEHRFIEGSIAGDLFTLPAGPVGAALGFQIRRESLDDTPGANSIAANLWSSSAAGRTAGEDTVKELFAEVELPLIADQPFFRSLTLNLSGRISDYNSYGQSSTYKAGLNWQINPEWRLRSSTGTSFRAPALYELYLANQTSFLGQLAIDPCINWELNGNANIQANCAAAGVPSGYTGAGSSSALITSGGGAGILEAETARANTVGLIWTPQFARFSIALDYFDIVVNDQVRQFGAGSILNQCYSSSNFASEPFCTLHTRSGGAVPQVLTVQNNYVNVASQWNRGLDLNLRYAFETPIGDVTFGGQVTWQLEDQTQLLNAAAPQDTNGSTFAFTNGGPDVSGRFSTTLRNGNWTYFWSTTFIGKGSDTEVFGAGSDIINSTRLSSTCRTAANVTAPCNTLTNASGALPAGTVVVPMQVYTKQYVEATSYHDISARYQMNDWTFQAGIQNLFDERPPAQSSSQGFRVGTAALNAYDVIGRRGFVQVTRRF